METTTLSRSAVETFLGGFRSSRDQTLALLMVGAGLRCKEACDLRVGDVDTDRWVVRVRCGKGGKARSAIVALAYRERIAAAAAGRPADAFCAPSATGGSVATANVRRAFLKASGWSSVKCNPHLLRHTYAVELSRVLQLTYVQNSLGHSRATTTDIYLRKAGCDVMAEAGSKLLAREG